MADTKEHAAKAAGWKVGDVALFKGYQGLPEGAEELLKVDDPVMVTGFENDADLIVVLIDDDGKEIEGDAAVVERLYAEELEKAEIVPDEEVTDEGLGDATTEEADTDLPLADVTFAADASIADLRKLAEDNGQKAKGRSVADVKASLVEMGATEVTADAETEETPDEETTEDTTEEAAPAATATEIVPGQKVEAASVTSILEDMDALDAAKSLVDRAEQTNYTLGGVLCNIHETGVFKTLGYDGKRGFEDYVEKELGIQSRKARYLMQIYEKFSLLGVEESKLEEIGWSKSKELARLSDEDLLEHFDELVEFAKDNTRDDVISHVKTNFEVNTRNSTSTKMKTFTFRLAEEDGESVEAGLSEAMAIIGDQSPDKAFAYIVGDWRNQAAGSDMTLEDMVGMVEAKFGVSISYTADEEAQPADNEVDATSDEEMAAAE